MDNYIYISYVDLDLQRRDIFRCKAGNDADAMSQFYDWCIKNNINGTIIEIS